MFGRGLALTAATVGTSVVALMIAPPGAEAMSQVSITQDSHVITPGVFFLRIEGSDGRDDIQVGIAPDHVNYYRITDSGPIIDPIPPGCVRESPNSIRCPKSLVTGNIIVNLNGGSDSFKPLTGSTIGREIHVDGGAGNDLIEGRNEPGTVGDTLFGGDGDDTILGGTTEEDEIDGGAGNDYIESGPVYGRGSRTGALQISGGKGNDTINGTNVSTRAASSGTADNLSGGPGNDKLNGGDGNDKMEGGSGRDRLIGGGGNDRMFGGPGVDHFSGGPGRDFARGGGGNDRGSGGGGNDNFRD